MNVLQSKRNYKVFVAHVLGHLIKDDYRTAIDSYIDKCRVFLFVNTYDALRSDEIRREMTVAFPDGDTTKHAFWVVRYDNYGIPFGDPAFQEKTKIDLAKINQPPYKNEDELATIVLSKCDNERRPRKESTDKQVAPVPTPMNLTVKLTIRTTPPVSRTELQVIDQEIVQKNYAKALALLDRVLERLDKPAPEMLYDKALLLHNLNRSSEASEMLDSLLLEDGRNVAYNYLKALVLQMARNYDGAIKYYDAVLAVNPAHGDAMSGKASALEKMGLKKESLALLEQAIKVDPRNANAWYNLGVVYASENRYLEALQVYEKAIELDPENPRSFLNRGAILRKLGRYEEALQSYDRAIKLNPKSPLAYHNKGLALAFMGKYQQSLNYFNAALQRDPRYTAAWINRGVSFANWGNFEKALRDFRKALEIDPNDRVALFNEGTTLLTLRKFEQAESIFRRVYQMSPDHPDVLAQLGTALHEQENYEEAVQVYSKTIEAQPADIGTLVNRSASFIELHRYQDAINDCERALALDPSCAPAYYNKALALAFLSDEEEAFSALAKAVEIDKKLKTSAKGETAFKSLPDRKRFESIVK